MKFAAQLLVLIWLVLAFFSLVHSDFRGRKAKAPEGFVGFIGSVIVVAIFIAVLAKAGAFSLLH